MTEQLLLTFKQTLNPDNDIRSQAVQNLNSLKEQNVKGLISILIQILKSDYYNVNLMTYSSIVIYTWRLFPGNMSEIPSLTPFYEEYSVDLIQQLLECSFAIMTNNSPDQPGIPNQVRNLCSNLFSRIAALHVHYNTKSNIIQKLSETLATCQTYDDVYPVSQALQIVCKSTDPEKDEFSVLIKALFDHFANPKSPQVVSELLNVLADIISNVSYVINNEEIINNIIPVLLNLSTVDGVQDAAFKVWSVLNDSSEEIILAVANQLIEISLTILADENKSMDDLISTCDFVEQVARLELKYDSEEFIPIRSNAQALIISLTRVCCTSQNEECDQSLYLPYMSASQALKNILILFPDSVLESMFPMIMNLASSQSFGERLGALIILSRIIRNADNEYIGFQFIPSLFNLLSTDKVPCVICQAIKCVKHILMRIADDALKPNPQNPPNQEILAQLPQVGESCFHMMTQVLAISDERTQQQATEAAEIEAIVERSTINLSGFSRNADNPEDDLFSPIAIQAAGVLAEISRIPNFGHTSEVLNILLQNGLKYKVPKFFEIISKVIDFGTDEQSILNFFQIIIEVLNTSIQKHTTVWALSDLGENLQAYFARFDVKLSSNIETLLQILIHATQIPTIYASDALIPIAMLAKNFPTVFSSTLVNQGEGQEPIPAPQYMFNLLAQGLKEVENSEMIYNCALSLSYIVWTTNNNSEADSQSIAFISSLLAQVTPTFLGLLMKAISTVNLSRTAMRSCVDCVADLVNYQPQIILPLINEFIVFLRTFSIFDALNVGYLEDAEETQLMLNALARCILSIMKAAGPENAMQYKDIAENIIVFESEIIEEDGSLERLLNSTIQLIYFLSNLDKNFILEIISENEGVGTLILTARESKIEHSQEILNILGYEE